MDRTAETLTWVAGLALVGVAAMVLAVLVGRMLRRRMQSDEPREPFTLEDLRRLRASGQITEQEFHAMRAIVVARVRERIEEEEATSSDGSASDVGPS